MPKLHLKLNEDGSRMRFVLNDVPVTEMPTKEVDNLIASLAVLRAQMNPSVPPQAPVGKEVVALPDPTWWTGVDFVNGGHFFTYRDPGLGWRSMVLATESAARIAELFTAQREALATYATRPRS